MNKKIFSKLILACTVFVAIGTAKVFAADEETAQADTVAPVFDPSNQTTYIVKGTTEKTQFDTSTIKANMKATDDVDGKNVKIEILQPDINLASDGEYHLVCTATDKAGNTAYSSVTVIVDGMGPQFDETQETTYFVNKSGTIFDSKYNKVESLPETIVAKDSLGAFSGIGAYLTKTTDGNILFLGTLTDTPAMPVVKEGDILVAVDDQTVQGMTLDEAVEKVKGEKGTNVKITVIRDGKTMSFTIERAIIKLYEDEDCIATPDKTLDSIDLTKPGSTDITYTATDKLGNESKLVVHVIVIDTDTPDLYVQKLPSTDAGELEQVTTSGNPPQGISIDDDSNKEHKSTKTENSINVTEADATKNNVSNENTEKEKSTSNASKNETNTETTKSVDATNTENSVNSTAENVENQAK